MRSLIFLCTLSLGSPRVEGDEDEEDIDDIEHEFNIEEGQNKQKHVADMLHGKMSYGRGPESDEHSQFPPVIAGVRSRPVSNNILTFFGHYQINFLFRWRKF